MNIVTNIINTNITEYLSNLINFICKIEQHNKQNFNTIVLLLHKITL